MSLSFGGLCSGWRQEEGEIGVLEMVLSGRSHRSVSTSNIKWSFEQQEGGEVGQGDRDDGTRTEGPEGPTS
jgi:hypothetical protein